MQTEVQQIKGNVQSSQATAIVHHAGGTTLLGDATLLPRAVFCKKGIEMNLQGSPMMLTRTATIGNLLKIASQFTGKSYSSRSTASKKKALEDMNNWIATMQAAIPHVDKTTK